MTTVTHYLAETTSVSPLIGILYAEDFDDAAGDAADRSRHPGGETAVPAVLTQEDLDTACDAAVAAARLQWQEESNQLRTKLLASVSATLERTRHTAEQIAADAAEAAAKTILAMLSGALPHFCNQHGAAEVRAIVDHLLPLLRTEPRVIIRVHPELAPAVRQALAERDADFGGIVSVLPAAIEPGDVKIEWENGALSRDTRQILQAMQDALGQLGLQQPRETTSKRILAHAE